MLDRVKTANSLFTAVRQIINAMRGNSGILCRNALTVMYAQLVIRLTVLLVSIVINIFTLVKIIIRCRKNVPSAMRFTGLVSGMMLLIYVRRVMAVIFVVSMAVKSVWIADRIIYMRNLILVLFVMELSFVLIVKYV